MGLRLLNRDIDTLNALAEHRLLTVQQLAHLQGISGRQVARRRVAQLEKEGLVRSRERTFSRRRGRAEKVLSIAPAGVELLRSRGQLPEWVTDEALLNVSEHDEGHQLLLGWFRIHLVHLAKAVPSLDVAFLSSKSPLTPCSASGRPMLWEGLETKRDEQGKTRFIPDGVFRITCKDDGRSVLFFLEVDMGTEPLACPPGKTVDLRTKLIRYQEYLRSGAFSRYGTFWKTTFQGFRLLIVTCTAKRMTGICQLAQAMPPSDFVWITDAGRLFRCGLGDAIWCRGGRTSEPLASIAGRASRYSTPLPPLHR